MLLIAEGDENAFGTLFNTYTAQLHPYIKGIIKSEMMVEEIIQETFIRVWMNRDKLPEIKVPKAWIFTIASNLCFNYLRDQARQDKLVKVVSDKTNLSEDQQEATELKELKRTIQEAVDRLPPQRKLIWKMQREQGMKIAEIAEQLNIAVPTVKNTLTKSLLFIRKYLEEKGHLFVFTTIAILTEKYFLFLIVLYVLSGF